MLLVKSSLVERCKSLKPLIQNKCTILTFNIPGNGFDSLWWELQSLLQEMLLTWTSVKGVKDWCCFAFIGGSALGGGIAWKWC
jgi:hypothetical protein